MQTQREKGSLSDCEAVATTPASKEECPCKFDGKRLPVRPRSRGNDTRQQRARGVSMQIQREKGSLSDCEAVAMTPASKEREEGPCNLVGERLPV